MYVSTGKVLSLDLARSVAILFAMIAHALTASGAGPYVQAHAPAAMAIVRLATPMFITLFGAILEIVYYRRVEQFGPRAIAARMFERSMLCWLLYILSNLPFFVTGRYELRQFPMIALLLGTTPFSDILRYYAVLFVLSPLILLDRARWGLLPLIIGSGLLLAAHPFYVLIPAPSLTLMRGVPARFADLFFGIGDAIVGPSVLHSLFLVSVGMALGRSIAIRPNTSANLANRLSLPVLIVLLALGTACAAAIGPEEVTIVNLADKVLRNANHPFYFLSGALATAVTIAFLRYVRSPGTGPFRATMPGQRSLFIFSFGNGFLAAVMWPNSLSLPSQIGLSAILLVAILVASALYDVLIDRDAINSRNAAIAVGASGLRAVLNPVNSSCASSANRYRVHFPGYRVVKLDGGWPRSRLVNMVRTHCSNRHPRNVAKEIAFQNEPDGLADWRRGTIISYRN